MPALSQRLFARRADATPSLVMLIVCAGVVLASLDLFIVNVALPQIARDFHLRGDDVADLSWVLNAYAIVYAALLVWFGRAAERYPREHGFLLGVAIFVVASAACGAATSLPMLIAFRVVQAAGAALLTPTSLGLILATTPAERRSGAVRAWTAVGGLAAAAGPVVGGLLVAASWRWVFLVNEPIGLAALVIGWRRLPDVPGHAVPAPDALGALLITGGVGALVLGLVKGASWGWDDPRTLAALAGGVLGIGLFTLHCLLHRNPLIDRDLFRLRPFTGASVVALFFSAAFGAMLISRVLWMQDVWHWSALATGLAIAPGPLMVPLFSFVFAGPLIARFGPGLVIAAGSTIFAAGAASLPPHSFATGSAVVNMLRQIGLAIGVAVFIAILGTPGSPAQTLLVYERASWVIAAIALGAGAIGLALLARPRQQKSSSAIEPLTTR
jgi:EmrB/QacA subfamily drug resistance transporter